MASGAVLVAVLALLVDLILATVQRHTVSRGITGRYRRAPAVDAENVACLDVGARRRPRAGPVAEESKPSTQARAR